MQFFAFGQTVADTQLAVVGDADDVAGKGVFRQFAFLCQEHDRRGNFYRFTGTNLIKAHAAFEMPRANTHKGDAVAVFGIHIGLDFENKAGNFSFFWQNLSFRRRPGKRGGCHVVQAFQHFLHAEVVDGAAEKDRGQGACQIQFLVKGRTQFAHHFDVFAQLGYRMCRQQTVEFFVVEPATGFDGGVFL